VRALDPARLIAILPIGATEAHGPHLPLGTDNIIAEAMARAGAVRLEERGLKTLILPTLAYTAAPFAAAFPGTISISPATVTALVTDIARNLAHHAIPVLALANAHLDPAHLESLHAAVAAIREAVAGPPVTAPEMLAPTPDAVAARTAGPERDTDSSPLVVFPDLTRKPWGARLTTEFRSGACHAGQYETSIVLAERPDLVDDEVRRTLPAVPHSLVTAIRAGQRSFVEAGGLRAYFGDPAAASAEEGRRTVEVLGETLEEAVMMALASSAYTRVAMHGERRRGGSESVAERSGF
jgi:creatinine amidohydrolase